MKSINEYTYTLINAKRYEILSEGLFNKKNESSDKTKISDSGLSSDEKKRMNQKIDSIKSAIKDALSKIKSSTEYKQKMKETREEMIHDDSADEDEINYNPNFAIKETSNNLYKQGSNIYCDLNVVISDDSPNYLSAYYYWVLYMVKDNIKDEINNISSIKIGDECLDITFNI